MYAVKFLSLKTEEKMLHLDILVTKCKSDTTYPSRESVKTSIKKTRVKVVSSKGPKEEDRAWGRTSVAFGHKK